MWEIFQRVGVGISNNTKVFWKGGFYRLRFYGDFLVFKQLLVDNRITMRWKNVGNSFYRVLNGGMWANGDRNGVGIECDGDR